MKRTLEFLRLVDAHDGLVSLTNLALWVVLVKIASAGEVTLVDAGALFVTLLSYQGKKVINKGAETNEAVDSLSQRMDNFVEHQEYARVKIDELSSKVSQQQMAMGIKDLRK